MNQIPLPLKRKQYGLCVRQSVLAVFRNTAFLFYAWCIQEIVNNVTSGDAAASWISIAWFVFAFVLYLLATRWDVQCAKQFVLEGEHQLRSAFLRKMDTMPLERIDRYGIGDISGRFQQEIARIVSFYTSDIPGIVKNISFLLLFMAYAIRIHPLFAVMFIVLIPLICVITRHQGRMIESLSRRDAELNAERGTTEYETLAGRFELMCYRAAEFIAARVHRTESVYAANACKLKSINCRLWAINVFAFVGINLFVYTAGAWLAFRKVIDFGVLLSFFAVLDPLVDAMFSIPYSFSGFYKVKPLLQRYADWMNEPQEYETEGERLEAGKGIALDFDHVSFCYDDHPVVCNVDLHIRPGEKVLILGKSGVGKSTMLKLILGYYHAYDGEVRLSEHSLRNICKCSLYAHIAYVPHEQFMPAGSVQQVFQLFHPELRLEDMRHWLDTVELQSLSLQADLEPDAANLSGGERQRFCLALAMAVRKDLLVADEALSMVDADMQVRIMKRLFAQEPLTVIWVDHRTQPQIMQCFDRTVTIDAQHHVQL